MTVWLPHPLYQVFPLICIFIGFLVAALIQNPFGIILALCIYIYAYVIMWIRLPWESSEGDPIDGH